MSGSKWGKRDAYHLIVNTTDWDIKKFATCSWQIANHWFGRL